MNGLLRKILKIFIIVGAVFIGLIFIGMCVFQITRIAGKKSIFAGNLIEKPKLESGDAVTWKDDWIIYHGDIYDYNEDVMTFLIMGIDKSDDEVKEVYGEVNGGPADALFLLVFNPHDKSTRIIGINRNTMADVDIYDEYGNYVNTRRAQIAVQHGFGDGLEQSCELQKLAVSKLFFSLPIHGYAAINMSAIPAINDAIGGVDVTPKSSFITGNCSFVQDQMVHLNGNMAFDYLHYRDVNQAGSADLRLQRQKEYLMAYISKAKSMAKKNPMLISDIYDTIKKQMVTDLTAQEVFFLSTTTLDYSFNNDNLYLLKGYTNIGDTFEEFYADNDELIKLMIEVFYEKVDKIDK